MARNLSLKQRLRATRERIRNRRDSVLVTSFDPHDAEPSVQTHCESLQNRLGLLHEELTELRKSHARQIGALESAAGQCESELKAIPAEAGKTAERLERDKRALERENRKNEHLLELRESECTSLETLVSDLAASLDAERRKREAAEQESKRLSLQRSQRISALARQREHDAAELKKLREQNECLCQREAKLVADAQSLARDLQASRAKLTAKRDDLERLRFEFDAYVTQTQCQFSAESRADKSEIERLTIVVEAADAQLRESQQQLESQLESLSRSTSDEEIEAAVQQKDRTIDQLQQHIHRIQNQLQREAAARRKAEGAIKRKVSEAAEAQGVRGTWLEIQAHDEVERLKKHIKALENLRLRARQKATAEILMCKHNATAKGSGFPGGK